MDEGVPGVLIRIAEKLPPLDYEPSPGTYLAWLDCTPLGLDHPGRHFHRHARVRLNRAQIVGDRIEVDADSGRALGEGGGHAGFLDPVRQRAGAGIQPILAALPRD